jgi:hypothetical protein
MQAFCDGLQVPFCRIVRMHLQKHTTPNWSFVICQ